MAEAELLIRYDGGDADNHSVEMRSLARSMLGFERILSDGLIFLAEDRIPAKGERHALRVKAREPVIGSSGIPVDLTQMIGLLPLGWWFVQTGATELVSQWFTYVLSYFGGRKKDAEAALEAIVRMREIEARERLESQRMWHGQLDTVISRLAIAAREFVAPVGTSVDSVSLLRGHDVRAVPELTVDVPMADAVRLKGEIDVSDMVAVELRVDGFVHHNRKLNVENPDVPGTFISADVRDPQFDALPNVYTEAAQSRRRIIVNAKLGHRAGRLERIYIMDCGGLLDDAA